MFLTRSRNTWQNCIRKSKVNKGKLLRQKTLPKHSTSRRYATTRSIPHRYMPSKGLVSRKNAAYSCVGILRYTDSHPK